MKVISIVFLLASVVLALVNGLPTTFVEEVASENEPTAVLDDALPASEDEFEPAEPGTRFPRATCDLLSFQSKIISINHAACAAHCLAMRKGYKGGRCKNAVCHCRK